MVMFLSCLIGINKEAQQWLTRDMTGDRPTTLDHPISISCPLLMLAQDGSLQCAVHDDCRNGLHHAPWRLITFKSALDQHHQS